MFELAALLAISLAPAAGGALGYHLWTHRTPARQQVAVAVGQVPVSAHRHPMALHRIEGKP